MSVLSAVKDLMDAGARQFDGGSDAANGTAVSVRCPYGLVAFFRRLRCESSRDSRIGQGCHRMLSIAWRVFHESEGPNPESHARASDSLVASKRTFRTRPVLLDFRTTRCVFAVFMSINLYPPELDIKLSRQTLHMEALAGDTE